jgi:tetratricopeptide (TPR) repeat protein
MLPINFSVTMIINHSNYAYCLWIPMDRKLKRSMNTRGRKINMPNYIVRDGDNLPKRVSVDSQPSVEGVVGGVVGSNLFLPLALFFGFLVAFVEVPNLEAPLYVKIPIEIVVYGIPFLVVFLIVRHFVRKGHKAQEASTQYFNNGCDLYNRGHYEEALAEYNKCLDISPNDLDAQHNSKQAQDIIAARKAKYEAVEIRNAQIERENLLSDE